jgi:hypothetical protein
VQHIWIANTSAILSGSRGGDIRIWPQERRRLIGHRRNMAHGESVGHSIWLLVLTILKMMEFVNGKDDIPYMKWKKKTSLKPPTRYNQIILIIKACQFGGNHYTVPHFLGKTGCE